MAKEWWEKRFERGFERDGIIDLDERRGWNGTLALVAGTCSFSLLASVERCRALIVLGSFFGSVLRLGIVGLPSAVRRRRLMEVYRIDQSTQW